VTKLFTVKQTIICGYDCNVNTN